MKPHGPWKIKQTSDVYRDPFIHVWKDDVVRPDGLDGQHVVVSMKPGACVLAIDAEKNLHLTNEYLWRPRWIQFRLDQLRLGQKRNRT